MGPSKENSGDETRSEDREGMTRVLIPRVLGRPCALPEEAGVSVLVYVPRVLWIVGNKSGVCPC